VLSAILLDETYSIPPDFDPEAHLASSWGIMSGEGMSEVILRFTAAARPFVEERHWHPSQQIRSNPDGGCMLQVKVSEPLEMQPWIRSWGAQVEVIAPEWLGTHRRRPSRLQNNIALRLWQRLPMKSKL
jgi:hypothetical protein